MSKYSGTSFSLLLVDGYNLIAALMENASVNIESITQQDTPFGVENEGHTPIGLQKGILSAGGGLYDETVDAIHTAFGTVVGVARVICAALFGNTIGKPFYGFEGAYSQKYEALDSKDGLTKANVAYIISGKAEEGQIVQNLTAYTANWDTKTGGAGADDNPVDYVDYDGNKSVNITSNSVANPSVVTCPTPHGLTTGDIIFISGVTGSTPTINGERTVTVINTTTFSVPVNVTVGGTGGAFVRSNTANGGSGYCQCTAYSGFTNVVVKIQDSPDDITYADLITFTTITAITKERKTVSGTVDRYLSSVGTVTGAGSITVFSGFSRN